MTEVRIAKRRAIAARLLVCVVPIALVWGAAAPAVAAPPVPKLNGTDPASFPGTPARSTTPSVVGEAEPSGGITIDSAPWDPRPFMVTAGVGPEPTKHPEYKIEVFLGGNCEGAAIGVGTAGELEEAGVPVSVPANARTDLSAKQFTLTDEESACSNSISYWEGAVPLEETSGGQGGGGNSGGGSGGESGSPGGAPPTSGSVGPGTPVSPVKPQAPHIHTNPGAVSNVSTPVVLGSAQSAEAVLLYTSDGCSGSPVAEGPAGQLSAGFQVSVAPNAVTTFSAAAVIGRRSTCSESITYTEDSSRPKTRITMAPGIKTRKRRAVFRFKDITKDPPGTTFACKVDKKRWKRCASPFRLKHLKYGHHLVKIRATDLAGNVERRPVKRRFSVVHAARG